MKSIIMTDSAHDFIDEIESISHFSEILPLALERRTSKEWFERHLIDPEPALKHKQWLPCNLSQLVNE